MSCHGGGKIVESVNSCGDLELTVPKVTASLTHSWSGVFVPAPVVSV